jgi:hypothetical protein
MQDPKEKLRELATKIENLVEDERRLLTPRISHELGEWFVRGALAYLSGEEDDLGKALGLKRGPGRPKPTPSGKNYERAKKIFFMREFGKRPWSDIANEFHDADRRYLQRELKRYWSDIIADISTKILDLRRQNDSAELLERLAQSKRASDTK